MFLGLTSRCTNPLGGVLDGPGHLDDDVQGVLLGVDLPGGQIVVDGLSVDVLHDEVVVVAGGAHVDGLDDVVVVQAGRGTPFLVESLDEFGVLTQLAGQHLDGHDAVQAQLAGLEDGGHGPGPELAQDLESGDLLGLAGDGVFHVPAHPLQLRTGHVAALEHDFGEADLLAVLGQAALLVEAELELLGGEELALDKQPSDGAFAGCAVCHDARSLLPGACRQGLRRRCHSIDPEWTPQDTSGGVRLQQERVPMDYTSLGGGLPSRLYPNREKRVPGGAVAGDKPR